MNQTKGDPEQARKRNIELILDKIRKEDLISRAELSRALLISKMTTSTIVNDLLKKGLLVEQSIRTTSPGSGGRPPVLLSLDTTKMFVIGIDIGTTNSALVVGNLKGQTLKRLRVPTNRSRDVKSIVQQVKWLVDSGITEAGILRESVLGAGISVAGLVSKSDGYVKFSPDFNWREVHLRALLEERLGMPVVINNCTRVAALGERWYGAATQVQTFFYVNVGYGIGSAIVTDGRIYEHNSEFGHIYVTSQPLQCECGKIGCLEAVSSGHAIERAANSELIGESDSEWISAKDLGEMADSGDAKARFIFETAGKYLGRAISTVANLLSPQLVIVGGGVSKAGALLMESLMHEFNIHTMEAIKEGTEVRVSQLGMDAGVIGAMALALETFVFQRARVNGK